MTTPDEAQALLPVTPEDRELFKRIITGMVGPTKHNAIDGGGFDDDERMQSIASFRQSHSRLGVSAAIREAAIEADEGAIAAARALSARDNGALQSEMRLARQKYLAEFLTAFLARHRISHSLPGDVGMREAIERVFEIHLARWLRRARGPIGQSPDNKQACAVYAGIGELKDEIDAALTPSACAAQKGSTGANYPQDCDWPVCGCDPHADKVIAALDEMGLLAALTPSALSGDAGEVCPTCEEDDVVGCMCEVRYASSPAHNKAGGLWYRRWHTAQTRVNELEALIANPPKHKFWGAGEPDCPREIKAPNGELHTLRCKVCGMDNPSDDICRAALPSHQGAE